MYYLKSSLDRFIAIKALELGSKDTNLKSSLDRFIATSKFYN